jgi:predicted GNAT family acetyltransferase
MLTVTDNPEAKRYEGRAADDVVGVVEYHLQPGLLTILHTEVAKDFEGEGVGSQLLGATLDDVRARGLKVLAICPFARAYLQRHPEYADLVGIS